MTNNDTNKKIVIIAGPNGAISYDVRMKENHG